MMDKNEEKPQGYINPLDLIEMMFWMPREESEPEEVVEMMTTAEVMAHLKVSRAHLTKWSDSGDLKPVSRGKYDAAVVRTFVPPSKRRGKVDDV